MWEKLAVRMAALSPSISGFRPACQQSCSGRQSREADGVLARCDFGTQLFYDRLTNYLLSHRVWRKWLNSGWTPCWRNGRNHSGRTPTDILTTTTESKSDRDAEGENVSSPTYRRFLEWHFSGNSLFICSTMQCSPRSLPKGPYPPPHSLARCVRRAY